MSCYNFCNADVLETLITDHLRSEKTKWRDSLLDHLKDKPVEDVGLALRDAAEQYQAQSALVALTAIDTLRDHFIKLLEKHRTLALAGSTLHDAAQIRQDQPTRANVSDDAAESEDTRELKRSRQSTSRLSIPPGEDLFWIPYPNRVCFNSHSNKLATLDARFRGMKDLAFKNGALFGSDITCKYKFTFKEGTKSSEVFLTWVLNLPDNETLPRNPGSEAVDRLTQAQPFLVGWDKKKFEAYRSVLTPASEELRAIEVQETLEVTKAQVEQMALMQNLLLTVQAPLVIEPENALSSNAEILRAVATGRAVHCKGYAYHWDCARKFREDSEYLNKIAAAECKEPHRRYSSFGPDAYLDSGVINLGVGPKSRKASVSEFLIGEKSAKGYLLGNHGEDMSITPAVKHPKDSIGLQLPLVDDIPKPIPLLAQVAELFEEVILIQHQFFLTKGTGSCNLHIDDNSLFFVQLHGSRRFYIYPKQFRACLIAAEKENGASSSCLPQLGLFEGAAAMKHIPVTKVDLHPGDLFILDVNDFHAVEFVPDSQTNLSCAISWAIHPPQAEISKLKAKADAIYEKCKQFDSPINKGSRKARIPLCKISQPSNYSGGQAEWDIYWSIANQHLDKESIKRLPDQWVSLNSI